MIKVYDIYKPSQSSRLEYPKGIRGWIAKKVNKWAGVRVSSYAPDGTYKRLSIDTQGF